MTTGWVYLLLHAQVESIRSILNLFTTDHVLVWLHEDLT